MQRYNKDKIEVKYTVPEFAKDNEITSEEIAKNKFDIIEKEINNSDLFNFVKRDRVITYGDRSIYTFKGSDKEHFKIQYNSVSQKFKIKIKSKSSNFYGHDKALDLVDRIQDIILDEDIDLELVMSKNED